MEYTIHADELSAMLPQQECETCGAKVNDGELAHNEDTGISECDNCIDIIDNGPYPIYAGDNHDFQY